MPSERFTKARRVRRRGEFKRVFDLSLRMKGRYLTVLMAPNAPGTRRLGIVASRKLGDSVRRNRAKRLIREIFRRSGESLPAAPGFDVVVIPRRELFDAPFAGLEQDFRGALKRCAARLPPPSPDVVR
jgi:ribonuclease P protein component